jgi:hypothetical protein
MTMESSNEEMGIDALMRCLQGAIEAVIPWAVKTGLPVNDGNSYDDWDRIEEALYQSFICDAIYYDSPDGCPLPLYGFVIPTYRNSTFIRVSSPESDRENAFVDFSIVENRVEYVMVACLDRERDVIGYTYLSPSFCTYSITPTPPLPPR